LALSNGLPLNRSLPDFRQDACKQLTYPDELPVVSVVIIYYNEPLSSLLRNVVSVINRTPEHLLGEIILVDDSSTLAELEDLPRHVEGLDKVRIVHRDIHNGIVGARVRGAHEATYDVLVFLDSHSEVCEGWLEPLLGRIAEDRTRVVVPHIRGIDHQTLQLSGGEMWPPSKGSFNWRLTFTIVPANEERDMIQGYSTANKRISPVRSPVMPGGLFAMDRRFFFELGEYDPEILYYGGEHVELSFRVWQCGGSMEWVPCSNVGHIYREFNRFSVDPKLKHVNIGAILDRNDKRVAAVWMDNYASIFHRFRRLAPGGEGNLTARIALRQQLQCKPFEWFLQNVAHDLYVPDLTAPADPHVRTLQGDMCLDNEGRTSGFAAVKPCLSGTKNQAWLYSKSKYLQMETYIGVADLVCVRFDEVGLGPCTAAAKWTVQGATIRPASWADYCLTRDVDRVALRPCSESMYQRWQPVATAAGADGGATLSDPDGGICLDNMQRHEGPPGLYGCHGGSTQRWALIDGKLRSALAGVCIDTTAAAVMDLCRPNDRDFVWDLDNHALRASGHPDYCLAHSAAGEVNVARCDPAKAEQQWDL
jgi:polypeptide N-acetylgalactosaminyltransferase